MGLFGKAPEKSPRDQVREWNSKMRKQTYLLDRQIRNIQREEDKVKVALKQAAKKGDRDVCVVLAKEMVNARKAVSRIHTTKAQLNSVQMHMTQQLATLRVAGAMQKSTEVMNSMQSLVKVGEISETMRDLSREMMRAGIIGEMLEETLDDVTGVDEEDLEEEVQAEVDKVLSELTAGMLVNMPAAGSDSLPAPVGEASTSRGKATADPDEAEEEMTQMQKRLEALRS